MRLRTLARARPGLSKKRKERPRPRKRAPEPQPAPITVVAATPPALPAAPVASPTSATPATHKLLCADLLSLTGEAHQQMEAFLLDQRSPHTRRAYARDLKRLMQFLLLRREGGLLPKHLDRSTLIAFKEFLLAEGLEHTTVDRHLACLKSFFGWLVEEGLIDKSPADGVRFLRPQRVSRTEAFTDEEVTRILGVPDLHTRTGALHYAILMVLFYCGLRRSELCGLRTSQLGLEREHHVVRLRGKGNRERLLVLVPAVWSAIRHYCLINRKSLVEDQFLFTPVRNPHGGRNKALDPSQIFYIVTACAKRAGIAKRVSPHSCRATAISNARDHQVPDRAIQEFAGWASPDMITRYDKRKTAVEDSASHAIHYGEGRDLPEVLPGAPDLDPVPS